MSNISEYLLHENEFGSSLGLAKMACCGAEAQRQITAEEAEKMRLEREAQAKEYQRRRRASIVLELAEKILIHCSEITSKDAIKSAQDFLDSAETLMKTFELDQRG